MHSQLDHPDLPGRHARLFELLRQQGLSARVDARARQACAMGDAGTARRLRERAMRSLAPAHH